MDIDMKKHMLILSSLIVLFGISSATENAEKIKKGIIFINLKKLIFIQVLNYIHKLRGFVIL